MALYDKASLVLIPSGTKAGKVYSQKPVPSNDVLGDELVTNGTFDTDSDWTKGTGWTIANGVASCDGTQTAKTTLESVSNLPLGKDNIFKITFDIVNYSSGSIDVVTLVGTGGAEISDISGNGSYTAYSFGPSTADNKMQIKAESDFVGSIDNVSVRQVVDGDFDFTRSSYATRVNSQGLIEKERGNLLLQSNSFDTTWSVDTGVTLTSGQSGYDGSSDAWKMDKDASQFRAIRQTPTYSGVVTFSVYAKEGTLRYLNFYHPDTTARTWFDLQTGSFGTQMGSYIENKIEDVGGGWYRCSVSMNASSGGQIRLYPSSSSSEYTAVAGNIYIQDAQLEQGLVATDYIETTTSAVYTGITDNVPRLDYDGDCPSLLLEPQRQNLVTDSEYFESSFWQLGTNSTLSFVSDLNPSGTQGCYRLQNPASSSTYLASGSLGVINNDSVFSVYVKSNTGSNQDFGLYYISGSATTITFTATTEWQRFQINPTSGFYQVGINNESDAYSNDILVYGAQLEAGSFATSYIPTYGTSVTRNGDICNNAGDSTVFNSEEGVLYADISSLVNQESSRNISISDGTNSHRVLISFSTVTNQIQAFHNNGITSPVNLLHTVSDITVFHKIAFKYKLDDFALWVDGVEVVTSFSGGVNTPNTFNELKFENASGTSDFYGKCKAVAYFNRALTDTELADLTT